MSVLNSCFVQPAIRIGMDESRRWRLRHGPRSANAVKDLEVKQRRRRYLEQNPEYFSCLSHELADPLAYDRLIRRFQSPSEREADGRKKGYSGVLETDLLRADAKAQAVAASRNNAREFQDRTLNLSDYEVDNVDNMDKAQALDVFKKIIRSRFIEGNDEDIDYSLIDHNPLYDDKSMIKDQEDQWFDDEDPTASDQNSDLRGQTGVQDF